MRKSSLIICKILSVTKKIRYIRVVFSRDNFLRIEGGTYGICEETDEYIEAERLMAIPWTRLSIEGAEIRESLKRKYAR